MTKNENFTVYKHTAPNNKIYIGITCRDVNRRWQNGKNYKSSAHFNSAIKKYGWDNIAHEILFTGLSKDDAERKEIELIEFYQSNNPLFGYNIESGGHVFRHTEETKRKISESNKGRKVLNRRCHTEEEKKRVSEKLKGRPSPNKGNYWTEEQIAEKGIHIVCVETGELFFSIRDAERKTGLDHTAISRTLKGIYKQTGGMHFEYARQ